MTVRGMDVSEHGVPALEASRVLAIWSKPAPLP